MLPRYQITLIYICCIAALVLQTKNANASSIPVTSTIWDRDDVIGYYVVSNMEQCTRLCWSWTVCEQYSYLQASTATVNCLLHNAVQTRSPLPQGWSTAYAAGEGIYTGCVTRPCTETEVCVPASQPNFRFRCLSLHVHCGLPSVANATVTTWSGLGQGHTATFTCDPYFELTSGQSSVLTCEATSRWSPADVSCQLTCVNGGTRVGEQCQCPVQYSGTHCERYIRDCKEAFENGKATTADDGAFLIHPTTSSTPFQVYCEFYYGGSTVVLRRRTLTENVHMTWALARDGFSTQQAQSSDFFTGLERLHELSLQATYRAHVVLHGGARGAGSMYHGFFVGPETENYRFTYDRFTPRADNIGDNGFTGNEPITFSTHDRDPNGCASSRQAPGWYGPNCNGYTLFGSQLIWPAEGTIQNWNTVEIKLSREGSIYAEQN